jgi:hypothetical protein
MPSSRISVRRLFAATRLYHRLLQVNVELSATSRCKEKSLQRISLMLHSRHFGAKWLSGKGLKEVLYTPPWGTSNSLAQYLVVLTQCRHFRREIEEFDGDE